MNSQSDAKIISEYFAAVIKQLYGKETFNPLELENDLDELCAYLNVEMPTTALKIQKSV